MTSFTVALIITSEGDADGVVPGPPGPIPNTPPVIGVRASGRGGRGEDLPGAGQFRDAGSGCTHSCSAVAEQASASEGDAVHPARRVGPVGVLRAVRRRPSSAFEGQPGGQRADSSGAAARTGKAARRSD